MARKTSFYVSDTFTETFDKYVGRHGSPAKAITHTMLCLDTMYRTERSVLRNLFTQNEINLMLNNALSTHYTPDGIINRVLWSTEDEAKSVFDHYEVDRETILGKLRGLTVSQQYALVDWLIEMRGSMLAMEDPGILCVMKDGKPYTLKLSNEDTCVVIKTSGARDDPERWFLFVCNSDGTHILAEGQPEAGAYPNIWALAEMNGFEPVSFKALPRI